MHGQAYSSGGFEVGRLYLVSHVVLILIWHGASTAALTATVALHDDRGRQLWGLAPGTSYQTLACRALLAPWVGCSQLASAILLRSQQLLACLCGQHHCLVHVLLQAICCEHCFVISHTAVAFLSRASTL